MENDTRRIKKKDFTSELAAWKSFIKWLSEQQDDGVVKDCMMFEIEHQNRPPFIDRARTRFNKLRAYRELKSLEKLSGKTISINCL